MSDLAEKLRFTSVHLHNPMTLCTEAADEITRLRAEVERLTKEAVGAYNDGLHDGSDAASDRWAKDVASHRAEVSRLRAALATVLGTVTHGQNMTWEERIKIGRAALRAMKGKATSPESAAPGAGRCPSTR
jgi:hypothetical protein